MGRIFGGFTYNEPQSLYPGAPVEEIKGLAKTANQTYQYNQDAFDSLDVAAQNLSVLDKDYAVKKAAIDKIKSQLSEASQGRMELAGSKARGAAKEFATNQVLNAAQEDYKSYGAYSKDINDRKDLSTLDKQAALMLTQENNQNALELDSATGVIKNRFRGYTAPEKSIDVAMETRNFLNAARDDGGMIKHPKTGEPMLKDIGNGQYIGVGKWKGISQAQASRMASEYAMQSPMIQAYVQFQNDYNGLSTFGQKGADGKLSRRDIGDSDLVNLGYSIQNGKVGTGTGKKFKELPIYDANGKLDVDKAKAVYNQTWKQGRVLKSINPAAEWLAHYEEEWDSMQNRDYLDAKDKPAGGVTYNATQNEPVTVQTLQEAVTSIGALDTQIKQAQNEVDRLSTTNPGSRALETAKANLVGLQGQQSDIRTRVDAVRKDRDSRPEFDVTDDLIKEVWNYSRGTDYVKKGVLDDAATNDKSIFRGNALARSLAQEIHDKVPANKISTDLRMTLTDIAAGKKVSRMDRDEFVKEMRKYPELLSAFKDASAGFESYLGSATSAAALGGVSNPVKAKNNAYFTENREFQVGSSVAISNDEKSKVGGINEAYTNEMRAGTSFSTLTGSNLHDYIKDEKLFDLENADKSPDLGKSKVYMTTQPDNNGEFMLQFVAANSKGEDIQTKDGRRAQKLIRPQQNDKLANQVYEAGEEQYKKGESMFDKIDGIQMMANSQFRTAYKAAPENMSVGEKKEVTLAGKKVEFVKISPNSFKVVGMDKDGSPVNITVPDASGNMLNEFGSIPEFVFGLQLDQLNRQNNGQ